jgi:glutamyl-tRNA synthetase
VAQGRRAAYELAVVADDVAMGITEVVRGEDLLRSTARSSWSTGRSAPRRPAWCHLPLVRDAEGRRLAKRHQALSVRALRARGLTPAERARARRARAGGAGRPGGA